MSISENQKLRDTQQKEQIFTTVPVNCVEEDYLLSNGEAERDLKSSLTISRTASAQEPGTAREGRKASPPVEPPRPIPDETGTTKSAHCHLVTSCKIWCGAPTKHPIKQVWPTEGLTSNTAYSTERETQSHPPTDPPPPRTSHHMDRRDISQTNKCQERS